MGIISCTPIVFAEQAVIDAVKAVILCAPDPSVLPWTPLPALDIRAFERLAAKEKARQDLNRRRAEAIASVENNAGHSGVQSADERQAAVKASSAEAVRAAFSSGSGRAKNNSDAGSAVSAPSAGSGFSFGSSPKGVFSIEAPARCRRKEEAKEPGRKDKEGTSKRRRCSHSEEISLAQLKNSIFGN